MYRRLMVILPTVIAIIVGTAGSSEAGLLVEEDTIHVPKNTSATRAPDAVYDANDHGCNDAWAKWNWVYEDDLGSLGV